MNIWDFWAKRYNRLWVQKYSLRPTRQYILSLFKDKIKGQNILDLGCGPGELIEDLYKENQDLHITGLDFSKGMLDISKKRNPQADHILMDVENLSNLDRKFNIIISSHSLPYYKNPRRVMEDLYNLLEDKGQIIFAFASGHSLYDRLILSLVKLTTGKAKYPSDSDFRDLIYPYFQVEEMKIIKEKYFMPRIGLYILKKVEK